MTLYKLGDFKSEADYGKKMLQHVRDVEGHRAKLPRGNLRPQIDKSDVYARRLELFEYLKIHPGAGTKELMGRFSISQTVLSKDIKFWVARNLVRLVVSGYTRLYYVIAGGKHDG
jgi:hypothetical protein